MGKDISTVTCSSSGWGGRYSNSFEDNSPKIGKNGHLCESEYYRCLELEDGSLKLYGDGDCNPVDYCPICGYKAKKRLSNSKALNKLKELKKRITEGEEK